MTSSSGDRNEFYPVGEQTFKARILDLVNVRVKFGVNENGGATAGEMASTEPMIKAGINLDGFQFGGLLDSGLHVPFMFMWENGQNSVGTVNANGLRYP